MAEQRLNARLAFPLVMSRLADGYNLIRECVSRRAHHLAAFWKDGGNVTMTKLQAAVGDEINYVDFIIYYCVADF